MTGLSIVFLVILAVVIALIFIGVFHKPDPILAFTKDCRKQGMDFHEVQAAISHRIAFVQLRDAASAACIDQGGRIDRQQIDKAAEHLARGIAAAHGNQAGRTFIAWVKSCPVSEVLYDDARNVLVERAKKEAAAMTIDKEHAALMRRALRVHK